MFGKIIRTIIVLLLGIVIGAVGIVGGAAYAVTSMKVGTITDAMGSNEEIVSDELKDLTIMEAIKVVTEDLSVGTVERYVPAVSKYLDELFSKEPIVNLVEIDREALASIGPNNIGSITDCIKVVADLEDVFNIVGVDFSSMGVGFIEELSFYDQVAYKLYEGTINEEIAFTVVEDTSKKGDYFIKQDNVFVKTTPDGSDVYYTYNSDFILPKYCVYLDEGEYLPVYTEDGNNYIYNTSATSKPIYKVLPALNSVVVTKLPAVLSARFKDMSSADVVVVLDFLGLELDGVFEKFFYRPLTSDILTANNCTVIYDEVGNQITYSVEPVTNRLVSADGIYVFEAYTSADENKIELRDSVPLGELSNAMNTMEIGVLIDGYATKDSYELMRKVLPADTTLSALTSGSGINTDNLTLGDVLGDEAFEGNIILQAIGKDCLINGIGDKVNNLTISDIIEDYESSEDFKLIRKIIPANTVVTEIANIDFDNITEKITISDVGMEGLPEFVFKALGYTNKVGSEYFNTSNESHLDITVAELATITLDDVQALTLKDVGIEFEEGGMLYTLIPQDTAIKDLETVVKNNINDVAIHDIFTPSGHNDIIDKLLGTENPSDPVTVGNIGEKVNKMQLKDMLGSDIMTKVTVNASSFSYVHALYTYNEATKTYNIVNTGTFNIVTQKYSYTGLDYQNKDYYEVTGGIWFLLLAKLPNVTTDPTNVDYTKYNYGAYDTIGYADITVEGLNHIGEEETIFVADYKLKLLSDLGLIDTVSVKLYEWSINDLLDVINTTI